MNHTSDIISLKVHNCLHFTDEDTEAWQVEPKVSELLALCRAGALSSLGAALPKALKPYHPLLAQALQFTKGFHIHLALLPWTLLGRDHAGLPQDTDWVRSENLALSSSRESGLTRCHLQICRMGAPQD